MCPPHRARTSELPLYLRGTNSRIVSSSALSHVLATFAKCARNDPKRVRACFSSSLRFCVAACPLSTFRNSRKVRKAATASRTRRAELAAAARMAVKSGVPIAALASLSALLAPEMVEKVLDAYWRQNGETPKAFTIDLASRFLAIAKETKCIDDAACHRLDQMRQDLEQERRGGLTDKNTTFLRQVLTPGVWHRVVNLPKEMMETARSQRLYAPVRAAVTAQLAVAIAILSVSPVRLANLTAIMLGANLIKPDGSDSNYWLVFPDYDVKNRISLEYPLEPSHSAAKSRKRYTRPLDCG
jgi:hypothetical protein